MTPAGFRPPSEQRPHLAQKHFSVFDALLLSAISLTRRAGGLSISSRSSVVILSRCLRIGPTSHALQIGPQRYLSLVSRKANNISGMWAFPQRKRANAIPVICYAARKLLRILNNLRIESNTREMLHPLIGGGAA